MLSGVTIKPFKRFYDERGNFTEVYQPHILALSVLGISICEDKLTTL
jgi:dTDP-4-dehydrorhamnose 3,5-epimerase-like enzyme